MVTNNRYSISFTGHNWVVLHRWTNKWTTFNHKSPKFACFQFTRTSLLEPTNWIEKTSISSIQRLDQPSEQLADHKRPCKTHHSHSVNLFSKAIASRYQVKVYFWLLGEQQPTLLSAFYCSDELLDVSKLYWCAEPLSVVRKRCIVCLYCQYYSYVPCWFGFSWMLCLVPVLKSIF
jgi:hypothetical protein